MGLNLSERRFRDYWERAAVNVSVETSSLECLPPPWRSPPASQSLAPAVWRSTIGAAMFYRHFSERQPRAGQDPLASTPSSRETIQQSLMFLSSGFSFSRFSRQGK